MNGRQERITIVELVRDMWDNSVMFLVQCLIHKRHSTFYQLNGCTCVCVHVTVYIISIYITDTHISIYIYIKQWCIHLQRWKLSD